MKRINYKWILLLFVTFNSFQVKAWDSWEANSEFACHRFPITLRCPGKDVIQIQSAEYGRQNTFTCSAPSDQMRNTKCSLPEAKDIMAGKCNNRTQCDFTVSDSVFPDPCPGTHKYLRTTYKCVKYMFGCPGTLNGIGAETVTPISLQPQTGLWTKDPLSNPDHVFFVTSSGHVVHEYLNWDKFGAGSLSRTYNLPSNIKPGNLVIYDRNFYYVKENSQSIIRYSLITQTRTKEAKVPGNDVSIMVDENGLWTTYTQNNGLVSISKLDKDTLAITETWTTSHLIKNSLHNFIICGVLYIVNPSTGRVEYSYDTNMKQKKQGLRIPFDTDPAVPFGLNLRRQEARNKGRSFLRYNTTSLSYNPRDQLLYLWDSEDANAVYYKMHFENKNPTKDDEIKSTKSTTTHNTRRIPKKTTRGPSMTKVLPSTSSKQNDPIEIIRSPSDYCQPITRNNIHWPETRIGEIARMPCDIDSEDFATWRCIRELSMRDADWHVAGPDLSECVTWEDIGAKYDAGELDRASAFQSLVSQISENPREITEKSIKSTVLLMEKLLSDTTLESKAKAEIIVESVATITSKLLRKESLKRMDGTERTETVNNLINYVEKAAFMYADAYDVTQNNDPLVISNSKLLLQVDLREKTLPAMTSYSVTSFPNEQICEREENCEDVIKLADSEILNQKHEGPAKVVFTLYNDLGDYLSPHEDMTWNLDSKIISATLRFTGYKTKLIKPVEFVLQHIEPSYSSRRCVYWDFSESTGIGNWSGDGCRLLKSNETHTRCECNHLTTFAVLVNQAGVEITPYRDTTLDVVTSIGILIAIICLILCILTFCCFRSLQNDRNTIHKNLCICLLAAEVIFLFGINQIQNEVACSVVAGLLHYFFIAAFLWLALEGFQLYVILHEIFEENSRWKWYYLAGYGVPAIVVGVSAGINYTGYGTAEVCWLDIESGFMWSFIAPIALIIVANLTFLAMTVYKTYVSTLPFSNSGKINNIKASVRGAAVLLCILGITWAFGILWISEGMTIFAYLFCIFNAFQGLFIFIFHCLLPRKVREEYKHFFGKFPCCQNISGTSYVSNSMTFSKKYNPRRLAGNGTAGGQVHRDTLTNQSQIQHQMWNTTIVRNTSPTLGQDAVMNNTNDASRFRSQRPFSFNQPTEETVDVTNYRPQHNLDDVFATHNVEGRGFESHPHQNNHNSRTLQPSSGEFEYDRLQHHRHISPPNGHFHTGVPNASKSSNHRCTTVAHGGNTCAKFGPGSDSQSRVHDVMMNSEFVEPNYSGRIIQDTPTRMLTNNKNFGNTKRDSGIGLVNKRISRENFCDSDSSDQQRRNAQINNNNFPTQNPVTYESLRLTDPNCPVHNQPQNSHIGTANSSNISRTRPKSLYSDSDDAIVTDYSLASSTGSSSLHRENEVVNCNGLGQRYEEPICHHHHKRKLPDPAHVLETHRKQWHNSASDANCDETDLEVEMLTKSGCKDENVGPSSTINSDVNTDRLSPLSSSGYSHDNSDFVSAEERLITAPAGYRSGLAENVSYLSPKDGRGHVVPRMGYFNKNPSLINRNSTDFYPNRNANRSEEANLRMVTNL